MRRFIRLLEDALTEAVDDTELEDLMTKCLQAANEGRTDVESENKLDDLSDEPDFLGKMDRYLDKVKAKYPNLDIDAIKKRLHKAYGPDGEHKDGGIGAIILKPLRMLIAKGYAGTTYSSGNNQ